MKPIKEAPVMPGPFALNSLTCLVMNCPSICTSPLSTSK
jgi:hypothetical protein